MENKSASFRIMFVKWMLANTFGWIVGGGVGLTLYQVWRAQTFERYDYLTYFLVFGASLGVMLGTAQWFVLRPFHVKVFAWIAATLAGWGASFWLGLLIGSEMLRGFVDLNDTQNMILGIWIGLIGGFGAGFLQWLFNPQLNLKWRWALINTLAWSAALGATFYFATNKVGFEETMVYGWILMAILPGTIAGLVSGLPLAYWLHAPDDRDTGKVVWNNL